MRARRIQRPASQTKILSACALIATISGNKSFLRTRCATQWFFFLPFPPHRGLAMAGLSTFCSMIEPRKRSGRRDQMYPLFLQRSGNCYKVRLALSQLAIPTSRSRSTFLRARAHAGFSRQESNGQVPLLEAAPAVTSGIECHSLFLAKAATFVQTTKLIAPPPCNGCSSSSTRWSRCRRRLFLAVGWSRAGASCNSTREDGWERLPRAGVMEKTSHAAPLFSDNHYPSPTSRSTAIRHLAHKCDFRSGASRQSAIG